MTSNRICQKRANASALQLKAVNLWKNTGLRLLLLTRCARFFAKSATVFLLSRLPKIGRAWRLSGLMGELQRLLKVKLGKGKKEKQSKRGFFLLRSLLCSPLDKPRKTQNNLWFANISFGGPLNVDINASLSLMTPSFLHIMGDNDVWFVCIQKQIQGGGGLSPHYHSLHVDATFQEIVAIFLQHRFATEYCVCVSDLFHLPCQFQSLLALTL